MSDFEIVYDPIGAARVVWAEGSAVDHADRDLTAALKRHPNWGRKVAGMQAAAQRDSVPRVMGFEQGPWAGVSWGCDNGGQWWAFISGNESVAHPEWDRSFGGHPTPDEAIAAADAGLDALLAEIAAAES